MRELQVIANKASSENVPVVSSVEKSGYITAEQLDNKIDGVVEKIVRKLEPASALTPEVRGMVKAVNEVASLKEALKDPTSQGIEQATSTLVTTVLGNALNNMTGGGQQAQPVPLKNTLAQIVVNNLTGENSPLPQILDAASGILGKDKVREGYDAGMHLIEQQQTKNNLPNIILQYNENSQEDVVLYAQQMGYSDVSYAQEKLIEHKNRLYQEIDEYQQVQQGKQQKPVEEPMVEEPMVEGPMVEEPMVEEPMVEEPIIEESVVEEVMVEKPTLKATEIMVLHTSPKVLRLAKEADSFDEEIDDIINELGE